MNSFLAYATDQLPLLLQSQHGDMNSNQKLIFNVCYLTPVFKDIGETIHHGLLELGFTSFFNQSTLINEARNIIFGAHLISDKGSIPPDSIIFNLEQLTSGSYYVDAAYIDCLRRHEVWDYSPRNIAHLNNTLINTTAKYVPIGFCQSLQRIEKPAVQDIDVLFYGAINERRQKILNALKERGLHVVGLVGVYGPALDDYIARSKTVVNIHFYESKIFEIVRVSYLLNNKKAVVSEVDDDTEIDPEIRTAIAGVPYENLVDEIVRLVTDEPLRRDQEERAYRIFSQHNQADYLSNISPGAFTLPISNQPTTGLVMQPSPLFSIIIATHNRAALLDRAISSIRAQTYSRLQLIVVSDVHDPASYEVATRHMMPGDAFIERAGEPGPSHSRNLGLSLVTGDYFIFLDDDDSFAPDFLQDCATQFATMAWDNHLFYTNFEVVNERHEGDQLIVCAISQADMSGHAAQNVYVKNFIPNNCVIYPGALARKIVFDPSIPYEDWDFLLNACDRMPLEHLHVYGPKIHKNDSTQAEQRGKSNESSLLETYLKVYSKHPAPNQQITHLRQQLFTGLGLDLDALLKTAGQPGRTHPPTA